MKVYGFVGQTGTGKSFRAQWVAKNNNIEAIIDDGLLIKGNKVLCGVSAKKSDTKIASVKRAIFSDELVASEMRACIKMHKIKSVLILGTSDNMVNKIATALNLPKFQKIIRIEDVATAEEIRQAAVSRNSEGKHVIPVPTFELKKDFNGYMLDPLKIFRVKSGGESFTADNTIIRPTYSYLGKYKISDYAIYNIVQKIANDDSNIGKYARFNIDTEENGIIINMDVSVIYGNPIHKVIERFQQNVKEKVEYLTGINVNKINITVKNIIV